MPGALEVHLNRSEPHAIEVETTAFQADGSFDVVFRNHGSALHVYLELDDSLASAAELGAANHYVDADDITRARVTVDLEAVPVEGRLRIVTGYGNRTEYVPVRLLDPEEEAHVEVDASLGEPRSEPDEPLLDPDRVPLVALGTVAVLVAVVALFLVENTVLLAGILAALVGIVIVGALAKT